MKTFPLATRSKIVNFLFLLISIFLFQAHSFGQEIGDLDLTELDKYIEEAYQNWEIPGLAIAIVKNNQVVFSKGYGVTDTETNKPVDENTIFGIASNTKAMTAAALAILVDEKKISWDDKVQKYLPWFQLYNHYVSAEMTIRDLLCHRSGLKTFSGDLLWYASNYDRNEVIRRARYLEPTFGFRSGFGYSNIMFLTAGQIVEVVSGESWDDFLISKFFKPLEMKRTSTTIRSLNSAGNYVMGHNKVDGKQLPIPWVNWDNIAPAGSVNSSVLDMSKWMTLQLNQGAIGDSVYFSKNASVDMWTVQNPTKVTENSMKLMPTKHFSGYGLGWSLYDYHGRKIATHGGGLIGQISRVCLVPEEQLGIVILSNSINSLPANLAYEILDRYFGTEEKDWSNYALQRTKSYEERAEQRRNQEIQNRITTSTPSLELEEFVGLYSGELYGDARVSLKNGKLKVTFVPTPDFTGELSHWQYNTFQIKLSYTTGLPEGKTQFILNDDGKVSEMKIDIPNPDFHFTELKFMKVN